MMLDLEEKRMTKRLTLTLVALAIFVLLAVLPVSAYTANATIINQSATVFIGESGLNIDNATFVLYMGNNANGPAATSIAWFPSTAQATASTPEKTITFSGGNNRSFYINPVDFGTRTGNWYCWSTSKPEMTVGTAGLAFIVADPQLDVKVWDIDQNTDVTGKSVPTGTALTFRIETNTYSMVAPLQRTRIQQPTWDSSVSATYYGFSGYSGTPTIKTVEGFMNIEVKTDQGNILNALYNASSVDRDIAIPLTGLFVSSQPWYWGNYTNNTGAQRAATDTSEAGSQWGGLYQINWSMYWNTSALDDIGQKIYPAGTYTVTAKLDINAIKDNYKNAGADYAGKTVSEARTITIVSDTVKITANKDTVTRSKPFSVTVTGKPSTFYWVWVKGTSQMSGLYDDQPPMIPKNQVGVYLDTNPYQGPNSAAGSGGLLATGTGAWYSGYNRYLPQGKTGLVNASVPTYPLNGTGYYAMIKTNTDGVRTVEFVTSNQTKAQKYTIRVENNSVGTTTALGAVLAPGDYKTDEVDIKVEKGAVTITAAGDGSYYLGEEVKFSGTNTETVKAYLFITGPNLQSVGSSIKSQDPRNLKVTDTVPGDFQTADVASDNTWSWKWTTASIALDAGTYTVYAVSAPRDKDHLTDVAYGTVSIIIKKPFVSATVSQSTVAKGDAIFVRGTAEGKPSPGVAMWVLGKNYATRTTASVSADASFEFEIKDTTTKNLAAGQYFVVVQHPMQNNQFDINLCVAGGATVCNLQQGTVATANQIFTLTGANSLQGSDAAEALVQGINSPNVDDTYTKLQFLIEEPIIRVDAIGDRHVGDKFTITAQTNFAVDDEVLFEVYSSSFKPTQKSQSGEFSGATGTVKVTKGDSGMNKLSFDVDASTFKPDEYIVKATAVIQGTTGTALFNVLEGAAPTAVPTAVATTAPPTVVATTVPPTAAATPTKTPTQPGFGALVALIGLGAVAFLVVRKH
jgi:PGF-CTERM protein